MKLLNLSYQHDDILADSLAVMITRDPAALKSAIKKVDALARQSGRVPGGTILSKYLFVTPPSASGDYFRYTTEVAGEMLSGRKQPRTWLLFQRPASKAGAQGARDGVAHDSGEAHKPGLDRAGAMEGFGGLEQGLGRTVLRDVGSTPGCSGLVKLEWWSRGVVDTLIKRGGRPPLWRRTFWSCCHPPMMIAGGLSPHKEITPLRDGNSIPPVGG